MTGQQSVGIDFGTTNSTIAVADYDRNITTAKFHFGDQLTETFRSALYFELVRSGKRKHLSALAGPQAITQYLRSEQKGGLIQSLKSYLASRLLTSTNVLGRPYLLEDLVAFLIRSLPEEAETTLGKLGGTVVVGRPVGFPGAESKEDDDWAVMRLRKALQTAGFDRVVFEYERRWRSLLLRDAARSRRARAGRRLRRWHQRLLAKRRPVSRGQQNRRANSQLIQEDLGFYTVPYNAPSWNCLP